MLSSLRPISPVSVCLHANRILIHSRQKFNKIDMDVTSTTPQTPRSPMTPPPKSSHRQRPQSALLSNPWPHNTALADPRPQSDIFYTPRPQRVLSNGGRAQMVAVGSSRPTTGSRRSSQPPNISASLPDSIRPDNGPARIVVGVDFGTTYSGVAVVHSSTPEQVDIIKTYSVLLPK